MLIIVISVIISLLLTTLVIYEFDEWIQFHKWHINNWINAMISTLSLCISFTFIYSYVKYIIIWLDIFISHYPHYSLIALFIIICISIYLSYLPYKHFKQKKERRNINHKIDMRRYRKKKNLAKKKLTEIKAKEQYESSHSLFSFNDLARVMKPTVPSKHDMKILNKEFILRVEIMDNPPKREHVRIRHHLCVKIWRILHHIIHKNK